jgi:hypothetical protein
LCAQREISDFSELKKFLADTEETHPVPDNAIWMACDEGSEHFVMSYEEDASPLRSYEEEGKNES